jgi:hypothetical protein
MIDSEIDSYNAFRNDETSIGKSFKSKSNCDNKTLAITHSRNGAGLPKRTATHRKQIYICQSEIKIRSILIGLVRHFMHVLVMEQFL